MNANHSIITHINALDTTATIVVAKSIANNAIGRAIYAEMQIIREREARNASDRANGELVGKDEHLENLTNDDPREAPVGLAGRATATERLHEAAKAYRYGCDLISRFSDGNEFDKPQSVGNRVDFELQRLHEDANRQPAVTVGNSLAARAGANSIINRARESLAFMREWHGEIVLAVEGAFAEFETYANDEFEHKASDVAEDYVASLTGVARYQMLIVCVTALARNMIRQYEVIGRMRPGSPLAVRLTSDLGVVEGSWKKMRKAALESETIDAGEIYDAVMNGRNIRDLWESDRLLAAVGIDADKACAE